MPQRQSTIVECYARGRRVPRLQEARTSAGGPVAMLESSQSPGTFEMPVVSDLVLSQSVGRPLRCVCDLGAGRFPGQTRPADNALVIRLARLADQCAEVDERRGGLAPHQSSRVIKYMQVHLDRRITLAELAALCGLSPWHFSRAFRGTHGFPPHRYLTQLRIQRARELLERSPLSITAIALATGYSSQRLVRHFRKATGLPPGTNGLLYRTCMPPSQKTARSGRSPQDR